MTFHVHKLCMKVKTKYGVRDNRRQNIRCRCTLTFRSSWLGSNIMLGDRVDVRPVGVGGCAMQRVVGGPVVVVCRRGLWRIVRIAGGRLVEVLTVLTAKRGARRS